MGMRRNIMSRLLDTEQVRSLLIEFSNFRVEMQRMGEIPRTMSCD